MAKPPKHILEDYVMEYLLDHYFAGVCTLCGNSGIVDSRGVAAPSGVLVGRKAYCLCAQGQKLRDHGMPIPEKTDALDILDVARVFAEQVRLLSPDDVVSVFNSVGGPIQIEHIEGSLYREKS